MGEGRYSIVDRYIIFTDEGVSEGGWLTAVPVPASDYPFTVGLFSHPDDISFTR